jgi:5-(aminomethyl)-3-furanmethanol phosphate kinase
MWVVKLGGSLARDAQLPLWLTMLAEVGGGRVAIVPGGAAFADTVRQAQAHWEFDDLAAHNMAVLAMGQTALMLHALEPRVMLATQDEQIRRALHAGRTAVWMPLTLLRDAPDALTSWDVTSDSLALWLAQRLHAERLVIVKSCAVDPQHGIAELGARGVLDARFAEWAREADFPIDVVQRDSVQRVREALLGGVVRDVVR